MARAVVVCAAAAALFGGGTARAATAESRTPFDRGARALVQVVVSAARALPELRLAYTTGGYPWSGATCRFGERGGPYCTNPRDSKDSFDWRLDANGNGRFDAGEYLDPWRYYYRNCTSWVSWRLLVRNHFWMPPGLGDASYWPYSFPGKTDRTPAVGAVAQTNEGDFGHVAYVEAVSADRKLVTVSEYNYEGTGTYDVRTAPAAAFRYIHIADLAAGAR